MDVESSLKFMDMVVLLLLCHQYCCLIFIVVALAATFLRLWHFGCHSKPWNEPKGQAHFRLVKPRPESIDNEPQLGLCFEP
ncbi:hypothetical protein V6N11_031314 [Hibiscus sabdariffa]|uniref:Transmembrane protein n=1 Tax=Hibiscus sabdariffa TaxID=183260 RepID=A0ABR2SXU2_9ROSI